MKKKIKNSFFSKTYPIFICCVVVIMLVYCIFSLYNCFEYFSRDAVNIAGYKSESAASKYEEEIALKFSEVSDIAASLSAVNNEEAIEEIANNAIITYNIAGMQILNGEDTIYRAGELISLSSIEKATELSSGGSFACSEIYDDLSIGEKCISVYSPISDNNFASGVIASYVLSDILPPFDVNGAMRYCAFAMTDGTIIKKQVADGFRDDVTHNVYTYLYNLTENKEQVVPIEQGTREYEAGAYEITHIGEKYVACFSKVDVNRPGCYLVTVYSSDDLLAGEGYPYEKIFTISSAIVVVSIIILVMYLITRHKSIEQNELINEYDPILGCNSYNKFVYTASDILAANKISKFAVIYLDVNNFDYVRHSFTNDVADALIRHISNVVKKMTGQNETYGHISDDKFVMLVHYTTIEDLSDRIKVCNALITNMEVFRESNYSIKMSVGIYQIERGKITSVPDMVDRAKIAHKASKQTPDKPFAVFSDSIRDSFMKEAEIESKMDFALKDKEFCIFYQPKYNINSDIIDGAEALVRWYDPQNEAYVVPEDFVPLFEVNGFISKLDRYVFEEVCKFISECTDRGVHVVPISVNISRVTATQPDFLSFYIKMKNDYKIADNFLTLEFTESFAYENYETIEKIVQSLKASGFKCSIDDFGSGYSSFSVLKELHMDELKLDKLFLKKGTDKEKDDKLLSTVIELGKSFGMKVTQEGVENIDELRKLRNYGCDVIQGYYYSKPIAKSDFMFFVMTDTSLREISKDKALDKAK